MNDDTIYVETKGEYRLSGPELSDWKCEVFGMGPNGIVWTPLKGQEPNWFWRRMQYLAFGNKWVRR